MNISLARTGRRSANREMIAKLIEMTSKIEQCLIECIKFNLDFKKRPISSNMNWITTIGCDGIPFFSPFWVSFFFLFFCYVVRILNSTGELQEGRVGRV